MEYLRVLGMVASRLDTAGVPYMVSGSTALSFYGRPRMTRDIDIVIELGAENIAVLDFLFSPDFAVDREEMADAVRRGSMFNFIHQETVVKFDFIVRKDSEYRRTEFGRRRSFDQAGQAIWVVAPEDLILSKLVWAKDSHSEFQLRDVRTMLELQPGLDREYLEHWALHLGVEQLLAEVRAP